MRGLALIGTARFDAILRSDGNIQFFFEIAIEIPEQDAECAVRIREPSFVRRRDGLPGIVRRFDG